MVPAEYVLTSVSSSLRLSVICIVCGGKSWYHGPPGIDHRCSSLVLFKMKGWRSDCSCSRSIAKQKCSMSAEMSKLDVGWKWESWGAQWRSNGQVSKSSIYRNCQLSLSYSFFTVITYAITTIVKLTMSVCEKLSGTSPADWRVKGMTPKKVDMLWLPSGLEMPGSVKKRNTPSLDRRSRKTIGPG